LFSEAGVATLEEICRSLGLTMEQYRAALKDLSENDPPCATLLRHVPLADLVIARVIGATRDQVIGLRRKARERLARRLRAAGTIGAGSAPVGRVD